MIDEKVNQSDVVISCRIRLARNIAEYPFVSTCSEDQLAEIESVVRSGLTRDDQVNDFSFVDSAELEALERRFLLELKLVSAPSTDDTLVESMADATILETVNAADVDAAIEMLSEFSGASLTINEEDHLRITVTRNDLDLAAAWNQVNSLDDRIEQQFHYAFSPRWGYLTACPANVGTGMRVSIMVHLPALAMTGQVDKVFRSLQRVNVVARGVFGENAVGDFFRISNQATLGVNETELIEQVTDVIPSLIKCERQAREFLLKENREGLRRDVTQAWESLCKSDLDDETEATSEQVMSWLSKVRMGLSMGLLGPGEADRVNRLLTLVQLRQRLADAVDCENYGLASRLRDQIEQLEQGVSAVGKNRAPDDRPDEGDLQ